MELKRVVVTGIGALSPLGNTAVETWENVKAGKSGAGPITHFDATNFKTHFACEVKNFNGRDYIDRKAVNKMDLYTQYAVVASQEAVKDCGIDLETADKDRIGVIFGVGIGGIHTFEDEVSYCALHGENGPTYSPFFIPPDTSPCNMVSTAPTSPPPRLVPPRHTLWPPLSTLSVWARLT